MFFGLNNAKFGDNQHALDSNDREFKDTTDTLMVAFFLGFYHMERKKIGSNSNVLNFELQALQKEIMFQSIMIYMQNHFINI